MKYFGAVAVLLVLAVSLSAQEMRTWADKSGNKIEAKFVKVSRGYVYLTDASGKSLSVAQRDLSPDDATYVKAQAESGGGAASTGTAAAPAGSKVASKAIKDLFEESLTNTGKTKVSTDTLGGKVVMLYFCGSYLDSCKKATPRLAEFSKALEAKKLPFEVVYVSSDRTEDDLYKYLKENRVSWLTTGWRNEVTRKLKDLHKVTTMPLIVIIGPDGKQVDRFGAAHLGPKAEDDPLANPPELFEKWRKKAGV